MGGDGGGGGGGDGCSESGETEGRFRGPREKLLWKTRWRRKARSVENGE